jgi:hypothetical protein
VSQILKIAAFAGVASLLLASGGRADAAPGPGGSYHFTGTAHGTWTGGSIGFVGSGSGFAVSATEQRNPDVDWSGSATMATGNVVTIERFPADTVGVVGKLQDKTLAATAHQEYVAVFDAQFASAKVIVYDVSAAGARTESGNALIDRQLLPWERLPGNLIGLADKEVESALQSNVNISENFQLLTYAHLGVRVAAKIIGGTDRTALMQDSDQLFRAAAKGEPVWVRTAIDGGPVVDYGLVVPIDPTGAFSLNVGFHAGAHVTYTCDDQYPMPPGVTTAKDALSVIEAVPARTFFVPVTADEADSLPEGASRTLAGTGDLAFSAGASIGYTSDDLGPVKTVALASAAASVGISWGIHGDLQLQVTREQAHVVRVRWTKGSQTDPSASVNLLLGLVINPNLADSSLSDKVVTAVVNKGTSYTTIQLSASVDDLKRSELDVNMEFDLTDPKARSAYEAAVVGNLLMAQAVAAGKNPGGMKSCVVTSTLTDALTTQASLSAFKLFDWESSTKNSTVKVDTTALDGTKSTTNTDSYLHHYHGLFGGEDQVLTADASDRTVTGPTGAKTSGETLNFHYQQVDNGPSADDLASAITLDGAIFGSSAAAQDNAKVAAAGKASKMKKATVTLDVQLGNTAIGNVLKASDEAFLIAYGKGYADQSYNWDHNRIQMLNGVSLQMKNNATAAQEALRLEAWALYYAKDADSDFQKVKSAGTPDAQILKFRQLASSDGLKLGAVVAVAILAGGTDTHAELKLDGDNPIFDRAAGQASPLPSISGAPSSP